MPANFVSGFSGKEGPAWHNLEKKFPNGISLEEALTDDEIGMNFIVDIIGAETLDIPGFGRLPMETRAVYRTDNGKILGEVGPDYTPLQMVDKFNFFQPFLDMGVAELESGCVLKDGAITTILAKITAGGHEADVVKGDSLKKYLLLYDAYNGMYAVTGMFTKVRVVCWNTLMASISEQKKEEEEAKAKPDHRLWRKQKRSMLDTKGVFRIKHHSNVKFKLEQVQQTVDMINRKFDTDLAIYRQLAQRPVKKAADLSNYVKEVMGLEEREDKEGVIKLSTKAENILEAILTNYTNEKSLFEEIMAKYEPKPTITEVEERDGRKVLDTILNKFDTPDGPAVKNNWYGAYNAVNNYLNHSRGHTDESKLCSLWFGDSARKDADALELALDYAELKMVR